MFFSPRVESNSVGEDQYLQRDAVVYLQERLNQVLMEKKKESRSGMEIMNLLQVYCNHFNVV